MTTFWLDNLSVRAEKRFKLKKAFSDTFMLGQAISDSFMLKQAFSDSFMLKQAFRKELRKF